MSKYLSGIGEIISDHNGETTTSLLDEKASSVNLRDSLPGAASSLKRNEPFKLSKFRVSKGDTEHLFADENNIHLKGKNIGNKPIV